jgi:hypothetical protein
MVDKEPPANLGSRVNFDACQEAIEVGQETSQESELMSPEEVGETMKPEGVEARIEEDDFQLAPCRGVFGKNRLNIFS